MPPTPVLGEQKDFVSSARILQKQPVRTLRITLWASVAGWLVGTVGGTVGGFFLTWTRFGPYAALKAVEATGLLLPALQLSLLVAIGMLPVCALVVAPLTFLQLGRTSRWSPALALAVGGAGGVAAFFLWLAVLSLFSQPFNWSRSDDRAAAGMFTVVAFLIGATTGCAAALLARVHNEPSAPTSNADRMPPPVPYDY